MTGLWSSWFSWPAGGVWSNIVASFIWSGLVWFPTLLHFHRKNDRQHRELVAQNEAHHQQLKQQAREHHAALKRHLGITDPPPDSEDQ